MRHNCHVLPVVCVILYSLVSVVCWEGDSLSRPSRIGMRFRLIHTVVGVTSGCGCPLLWLSFWLLWSGFKVGCNQSDSSPMPRGCPGDTPTGTMPSSIGARHQTCDAETEVITAEQGMDSNSFALRVWIVCRHAFASSMCLIL